MLDNEKYIRHMLIEEFKDAFGDAENAHVYFAPGRINLIGEHIDYIGGYVLPCAINLGTYAVVRKRNDNILRMYSKNFKDSGVFTSTVEFKDLDYKKEDDWTNYPKGVIELMKMNGYNIESGMDIYYFGTLPNCSGLSSSASIEVVTAYFIKELFNFDISTTKIALICQKSENVHMGVNCGIMDQFAIAKGKANNAILINTNSLAYQYIPLDSFKLKNFCDAQIVIMNTNKQRKLEESKYNERRQECELGLNILKKNLGIEYIDIFDDVCEYLNSNGLNIGKCIKYVDNEFIKKLKKYIDDEVVVRRMCHVIGEQYRVKRVAKLISDPRKILQVGELMNQSHDSLRYNYEVTGFHLDTIVEEARKQRGVFGVRMTGAGFGGCAIALVNKEDIGDFIFYTNSWYYEKTGINAEFYTVDIVDGPKELKI